MIMPFLHRTDVSELAILKDEEVVLLAEVRQLVDEVMIEILDDVNVCLQGERKWIDPLRRGNSDLP
jgi:hypothetical protein